MRALFALIVLTYLLSCSKRETTEHFQCRLVINDNLSIPFLLVHEKGTEQYSIVNAQEEIRDLNIYHEGDSVIIEHSVFNSVLKFKQGDSSLHGWWYNQEKGTYKMPLEGSIFAPVSVSESLDSGIGGRWKVVFHDPDEAYDAVGIFEENEQTISGTFLTETGDYRYLAGGRNGNALLLSTFDMSHAFLFTFQVDGAVIKGDFYSGNHYHITWSAYRDPKASLQEAVHLSSPDDSTRVRFSTTGLSGEVVDQDHPLLKDKAVVIQLFGSWCPNCYDESKYLASIYSELQESGIEVLGVGFERSPDFESAKIKLEKFRRGLNIPYPLVYGSTASKDSAASLFPFLEKVKAFPTLVFLDSRHSYAGMHEGFNGPANEEAYEQSKEAIHSMLERITDR